MPKYKNMYKIKKTQPTKRGNMQNLERGEKRMFRIAICDDEKIFRDDLKEILIRYMTDRGIMLEIDTFSSGKEFVELGIEMVKYKIVFLDINMDELDGIMTAKKIRENSKDMFIVFVTAFVNYTIEGYKVDAVRYILKDNKICLPVFMSAWMQFMKKWIIRLLGLNLISAKVQGKFH